MSHQAVFRAWQGRVANLCESAPVPCPTTQKPVRQLPHHRLDNSANLATWSALAQAPCRRLAPDPVFSSTLRAACSPFPATPRSSVTPTSGSTRVPVSRKAAWHRSLTRESPPCIFPRESCSDAVLRRWNPVDCRIEPCGRSGREWNRRDVVAFLDPRTRENALNAKRMTYHMITIKRDVTHMAAPPPVTVPRLGRKS
jgi:hypothetical protein